VARSGRAWVLVKVKKGDGPNVVAEIAQQHRDDTKAKLQRHIVRADEIARGGDLASGYDWIMVVVDATTGGHLKAVVKKLKEQKTYPIIDATVMPVKAWKKDKKWHAEHHPPDPGVGDWQDLETGELLADPDPLNPWG